MKSGIIAVLFASLCVASAHAQRALVMGDGNQPCSLWIKESASAHAGTLSVNYIGMAAWVTGFLSGVNSTYALLAAPDPEDLLLESKVTPQEIMQQIGVFCAANPRSTLFHATDALVTTLQNRLLQRQFLERHPGLRKRDGPMVPGGRK